MGASMSTQRAGNLSDKSYAVLLLGLCQAWMGAVAQEVISCLWGGSGVLVFWKTTAIDSGSHVCDSVAADAANARTDAELGTLLACLPAQAQEHILAALTARPPAQVPTLLQAVQHHQHTHAHTCIVSWRPLECACNSILSLFVRPTT